MTALAFVLIIGEAERFQLRQAGGELSGTGAAGRLQRESATAGTHHQAGEFDVALFAGGSGAGHSAQRAGVAQQVLPPDDATRTENRQGRHGAQTGGSSVLDDGAKGWDYEQWKKFGSHAGQPGNRDGVQ